LKNTGLFKYATGVQGQAVKTQEPSFVIAQVADLAVRSDILTAEGKTFYSAQSTLNAYLALHPEESDNLQIIAVHEVAA
jgi:hypothetical protein